MTQILPCAKCKKEIDWIGNSLEVSHNIPKYMGGTDKDGRKLLCPKCHEDYEFLVLSSCMKEIFNETIIRTEDRRDYIPYYNLIRSSSETIKSRCRIIASQKCKEFYEGTYDGTSI